MFILHSQKNLQRALHDVTHMQVSELTVPDLDLQGEQVVTCPPAFPRVASQHLCIPTDDHRDTFAASLHPY